jgi:hypothetical protein
MYLCIVSVNVFCDWHLVTLLLYILYVLDVGYSCLVIIIMRNAFFSVKHKVQHICV